ncbi:hypothetical protein AVEN_47218-1 [Araneus ventricosus]|uniref:Uncharacterized protein n=1 Tax=Araneus ventricosus TaxID=182803 RepID=A0A4Y2W4D0_ARAVE|nr:hypothetical protein AVEN_47218-1 [Araneus ventricosus]
MEWHKRRICSWASLREFYQPGLTMSGMVGRDCPCTRAMVRLYFTQLNRSSTVEEFYSALSLYQRHWWDEPQLQPNRKARDAFPVPGFTGGTGREWTCLNNERKVRDFYRLVNRYSILWEDGLSLAYHGQCRDLIGSQLNRGYAGEV